MRVNTAEAKAKLSELIAAAERGEDVVIARGGGPVVRLAPAQAKGPAFRVGIAEEEIADIPDFLDPMSEDEIALWT